MTPLNTIIEEEKKNIELLSEKDWEYKLRDGGVQEELFSIFTTAIQRAYEAGQREERAKAYEEGDSDGYLRCLKYYFPEDYEESDKTNGL